MGTFIRINNQQDFDHWLIPATLIEYDQRNPPWPNDLFPYLCVIDDSYLQDPFTRIFLRRFCEQKCEGDIAVEKCYTSLGYKPIQKFWFEFKSDMVLFATTWKNFLYEEYNV